MPAVGSGQIPLDQRGPWISTFPAQAWGEGRADDQVKSYGLSVARGVGIGAVACVRMVDGMSFGVCTGGRS